MRSEGVNYTHREEMGKSCRVSKLQVCLAVTNYNKRQNVNGCLVSLFTSLNPLFNTLRLRQNGRHFAVDTFKHIFMNENVRISVRISLRSVPKGPIDNIPELVQIMAWRRPGDKPLSESIMVRLPTYIWVIWPQWVNPVWPDEDKIITYFFLFSLLSRMREQGVQFTSRLWPCNSLSWLKAMGTATAQHIWCVHTTSGWCMYVNFSELLRE